MFTDDGRCLCENFTDRRVSVTVKEPLNFFFSTRGRVIYIVRFCAENDTMAGV